MATVRISNAANGLVVIDPQEPGTQRLSDAAPNIDTAVVEVAGGHLAWSLLGAHASPVAVLDDVARAQDWVWGLYGEAAAIALAEGSQRDVATSPAMPDLAAAARRLAFTLWAQRWWPASVLDGIPPLDAELLERDIAALVEQCDVLGIEENLTVDRVPETLGRAEDYALAAGAATATAPGGLVLARGIGGSDWRRYPAGLIDASDSAVSWELRRTGGRTVVMVNVVAAPGLRPPVPAHLQPHATVRAGDDTTEVELNLLGDNWFGEVAAPDGAGPALTIDIHVPGFGPTGAAGGDTRAMVRTLARRRLDRATSAIAIDDPDAPLLAEIAAAAADTDF